MPDPRPINQAGEWILGYKDGTTVSIDEYGRRPGQVDYKKETEGDLESSPLYRFKGKFARLFGPLRRGRSFSHATLDTERDTDEYHQYHLDLEHRRKSKRVK